ncbi:amidohydrolase/deacetylase family metallohydrolase [Ohtaekwangia koreensis]|uniref:Dihydroorotase n=1 Tax=Ohtaekwangia koreensis TaxID=688867 RepID=A0A1T5JGW4_9BACT|nr:amidohydrolase/deacetylase family metallohydrolase [Ohtaekwangia koreensis]SKC50604.1 dihydroorotase [Ohtaekwangia koreensis]
MYFEYIWRRIAVKINYTFLLLLTTIFTSTLFAQDYSVILKGGHVIDPKNAINAKADIAIRGDTIAAIGKNLDGSRAKQVIDVSGMYITPGLIDLHSHNFYGTQPDHYLSDGFEALPPDGFTFRCGITTVVDAGGAGWKNFSVFKNQTIRQSKTRVLSFINIVGEGMRGGPYEQNINDMDARMTALVAQQHREIVGVKVAHYSGNEWEPIDRAVAAGKIAHIPVMVDFGGHIPPLSLEELLMKHLRPGDIFTHAFARVAGRIPIIDAQDKVFPFVKEAQQRGIIFDVGHGGGSFLFSQAVPAIKNGFFPNTISTDIHTGSMNGGMKDLLNVMSKFLTMGMNIYQVIQNTTWNPAQAIRQEQLGNLSVGAVADIAVFTIREGKFGFVDSGGNKMTGTKKLECELTLRDGKIVYDLNGISRPAATDQQSAFKN